VRILLGVSFGGCLF